MELMITVAIVGILAAIALPSYKEHIVRGNRAAAQTEMLDIANREQQFFLANRVYTTSLTALSYAVSSDTSSKYTNAIAITGCGDQPCFMITFSPISTSMQSGDGDLVLYSTGVKTRAGDAAKW